MANEDVDQVHIRAELASVNYNPISALAVAYLDLAEQRPELFGDLDLAEESKQTLERVVDEGRNAG
jgi:hypothetical protein